MNFMDQLLVDVQEKEEKIKLELDRLRADQLLTAIAKLEQRADEISELADNEVKLIEEYRSVELIKVQKKISWLAWNLDQFVRSSGEKTINLPHGVLKLRLGRDKVTVIDLQQFLDVPSNRNYLRIIPETYEANIQAIHEHIKATGHIPDAVDFKPAETKFSYKTIRSNNGKEQRTSEARSDIKSPDESEVNTQ
jgi:phage host-nuclease inhibitor protein Gam